MYKKFLSLLLLCSLVSCISINTYAADSNAEQDYDSSSLNESDIAEQDYDSSSLNESDIAEQDYDSSSLNESDIAEQGYDSFSLNESDIAIPTGENLSAGFARASVLTYSWGLSGSVGWLADHNITATSRSYKGSYNCVIDKMITKLTFKHGNGTKTVRKKSQTKVAYQSVNLFLELPRNAVNKYVSKHVFQNTGYVTVTKKVTKTPSTI